MARVFDKKDLKIGLMARPLGAVLFAFVLLSLLVQPGAGAQETETSVVTPDSVVSPTTTLPQGRGPGVTAVLSDKASGDPIPGIDIVVSQGGSEIARGTSDEDGGVLIPLDSGGRYEVAIDEDTFPDGYGFTEGARTELTPVVLPSNPTPVIFSLQDLGAEVADGATGTFERFLSLLVSGTRFGLVIAVASVGLSLIFGTTGLTNFAHGEMVAFGAIFTWFVNDPSTVGLTLMVAAIFGVIASGFFGAGLNAVVFRPLRDRGMSDLSSMVVSIGLAFLLRYAFQVIFGPAPQQYKQYAAQAPSVDLGPISVRPKDLAIIAACLVVLIAVGVFLQRSRLGTAIRAVSDNADLSESSGIDVRRVTATVWALSGALAGLGGVFFGITDTVNWDMGKSVLLIMFAAVVLGGLGTTYGAMAGGLMVGIVSDVSTLWLDSDLKIVVALAILIVVLLVRPQGIFGVKDRRG